MERTFAWLARFRRLTVRYERRADLHLALTTLARAVICLRQIRRFVPVFKAPVVGKELRPLRTSPTRNLRPLDPHLAAVNAVQQERVARRQGAGAAVEHDRAALDKGGNAVAACRQALAQRGSGGKPPAALKSAGASSTPRQAPRASSNSTAFQCRQDPDDARGVSMSDRSASRRQWKLPSRSSRTSTRSVRRSPPTSTTTSRRCRARAGMSPCPGRDAVGPTSRPRSMIAR